MYWLAMKQSYQTGTLYCTLSRELGYSSVAKALVCALVYLGSILIGRGWLIFFPLKELMVLSYMGHEYFIYCSLLLEGCPPPIHHPTLLDLH
jgi:hypothetical protein